MILVVVVLLVSMRVGADRLRAPDGSIRDVPSESVEFALRDGYTRIAAVTMRAPGSGYLYDVDEDLVRGLEAVGFWKLTPSEVESVQGQRRAGDVVNMRSPEGGAHGIPLRQVAAYAAQGFTVETTEQSDERIGAEVRRDVENRGMSGWLIAISIGGGILVAFLLVRWLFGRAARSR